MAGRRSAPSAPDVSSTHVTVPQWDQDPVWSLRPWPVLVALGEREAEIPALPAADWLNVIMRADFSLDDLLDLIPDVDNIMDEEDIHIGEYSEVCVAILEAVSARRWWISLRLIEICRQRWDVLGPEMLTRADAEEISLAGWLTILLSVMLSSMDPKKTTSFTLQIEAPPPGEEVEDQFQEMSASSFLAMGR